jgi:large subunit ribosomal protein L17
MRHGINGRKFSRHSDERKALFKGLAASLLKHEQIKTTLPKAKDLRPLVERMITLGKRGGLSCRRQAISLLGDQEIAAKIMGPLAERYKNRAGGYVRIVKAGVRPGDNSPMAIIELVDRDLEAKGKDSGPTAEKKVEESSVESEK